MTPLAKSLSEIERKRLDKETDNKNVTAAQALKLALDENIEWQADGVVIVMFKRYPDTGNIVKTNVFRAGIGRVEELGLHALRMHHDIEDMIR